MVKAIQHLELRRGDFLDDYECEVAFIPLGLPFHEAPWESDDRSISVANTSGSLWFRIYPKGSETPIAIATFAADADVVRCDSINVDEAHRRRGIANHAFWLAACFFEAPVVPSSTQLSGGQLFWHGRTSITC
jgi:hypothetical protein